MSFIKDLIFGNDDAEDAAATASAANNQLAAIAQAQWNRYLNAFAPLENKMVKEAQAPVEKQPGFGRLMATINRGYSDLEGNVRRTMGGRYPSGSGLERQAIRNVGLQKTTAKAGAVADVMQKRFDRMLQAANIGRNLPGQSLAGSGAASSGSSNLAQLYGQAQKSGWDTLGSIAGNLGQLYGGVSGLFGSASAPTWASLGGWGSTLAGSAEGADAMMWL